MLIVLLHHLSDPLPVVDLFDLRRVIIEILLEMAGASPDEVNVWHRVSIVSDQVLHFFGG